MNARAISSAFLMAAAASVVGIWSPLSYEGNLLLAQAKAPADPYIQMRAAGADNVPRITTKFHIDPWWPITLPNDWALGPVFGVCANSKDHVYVIQRTEEGPGEAGPWQGNKYGPPVLEFDQAGTLLKFWGESNLYGNCAVDRQDNVWIAYVNDAIVQKFSPEGKLLLTIGAKGKFDSSDGTAKGTGLNASHELLNRPMAVAFDAANGDVYIADGGGNRRVAVFDHDGKFLRQIGRQATKEEAESGAGGAFTGVVSAVALSNDGMLYVGDRDGKRIQVFDKMGTFKMNISVPRRRKDLMTEVYHRKGLTIEPDIPGKAEIYGILISRDQKYLYVGTPEQLVWTVERVSGKPVSAFGKKGYSAGEMQLSNMAIDNKGDLVIGSMNRGVELFRAAGKD